jgi:molybdopterin-containing oxidoreductase family membrane subunit
MKQPIEESALSPLTHTGRTFYIVGAALLAIVVWFIYAYWVQLRTGLVVTGLRDWGMPLMGTPWGLYIGNFIWFVGIAHGGIAVSAAVRLLKLDKLRPIARMAEVLTVITLMMAAMNIVIDMGRPDRVFNIIVYYGARVLESPLVWDFTVIMVYFILSTTYLYITMRGDLALLQQRFPKRWQWLYQPLLVGYTPEEKPKVEQIARWLAVCVLILMALLSGGVVPWLFGLMRAQVGWFGAVQGPYFLTAALTSAIAGVIIIAAIFRRAYGWGRYIKPEVFRQLGTVLAIFIGFYLWFILHEQLTMRFAGPTAELAISDSLVTGRFAPIFWTTVIVGFILPLAYLSVQAASAKAFRLGGVVTVSILVVIALWVKRILIVIPSLLYPQLPYPPGSYSPTWVEWSIVAGTMAMAGLFYMIFIKLFPVMELGGNTND